MALSNGTRVGPYEILSALGAGGMGEVYKARDTRLDRTVAIKILPEALASDPQFRERFDREARAISQLDHPNICTLYDVGREPLRRSVLDTREDDGPSASGVGVGPHAIDFLVMQYLEGETLQDRLAKGALPLDQALKTAIEIASALDKAHRAGIVHRDLKPGNIMLTKGGAKLLDFGLAKATAPVVAGSGLSMLPTTPPNLTAQGTILGTFQYMAPEQLEGQEADARSDIFAFGAVVYEMLTGRKAFEGKSQASLIGAIMHADPAPISTLQPLTPLALDHVIKRCLVKDRADRWQSAGDVMHELRWAVEYVSPTASNHPESNRKWWWVAIAALVVGALGGWTAAHLRQLPTDDRVIRFQIEPPDGGHFVFGTGTGGIAISPDGNTLAFVASVGGRNALWVRSLEGAAAHVVPGTDGAGYPFWSPDSRWIAFFAGTKLQRVDLAGSNPLVICDTRSSTRGGTWSRDGFILYGTTSSGLFKVPASGGTPMALTMLERGEASHNYPQMLTGDRFLYWAVGGKTESTGIYASSLAEPRDRVLLMTTEASALYTSAGDGRAYLLWTRGGTMLAQEFDPTKLKLIGEPHPVVDSVAAGGLTGQMLATTSATGMLLFSGANVVSQFMWVDRTGNVLSAVGEPAAYSTFRLSPDGRRVIASRDRADGADLWLVEVDRDGVATRITSRPTPYSSYPIWSPDGQTVAFGSDSPTSIFRKPLSGAAGSEQRLWQAPNQQLPMDWSRDGGSLLFYDLVPGTGRDLAFFSMTSGDSAPKSYLRTPFSEWWGRFAPEPNPRWLAYQSDESGRYEIYVDAFPLPRARKKISTGGGQFPAWNPNGRELFYVSPEFNLMAASVLLGSDSVAPSAPRALFPLPAVDTGRSPYDVSPDGQRFLVRATPRSQAPQSLTVVVNWPAALRK